MFLGQNLLAWLVLALGASMAAGNLAALLRPRPDRRDPTDLDRAPLGRSILFMVVGSLAAVWAIASLLSS
ncbi:MAG: hypothetical protein F4110_09800 [Acidimicrobiaceae bacterium]|nr:hypothetical protein [Acidimicrobiaceae bacterium]MYA00062.1 hypothetical protein [Acidimicrobiaceae bacterium]MYE75130.1 hypothetical protein [Acidimicrobiaceae bacterium]MYE98085.1 hypothetical protein [Acidimicrobiaceae bacterium]MYH42823.1 hypothetical protein [Acidimicrobiaceae bacterium]